MSKAPFHSTHHPTASSASWTVSALIEALNKPVNIAPLAFFRIFFGLMMCGSAIRFLAKGWVKQLYVDTPYHFKYWGFEWVSTLGNTGTHLLFVGIAITALMVALGWWYRISISAFFLLFSYAELMDATNYLNHYYFISVVAFLLIWLPAHRKYSLDVLRHPSLTLHTAPAWILGSLKLQIGLVYFFAGLAKVNADWLLEAEPLHHWLRSKYDFPILGQLFRYEASAYFFSWAGCLYDLSIPFLLLWRKTRPLAFMAVVFFHIITWALFPIGVFPFIMIGSTLLFFPSSVHERILKQLQNLFAFVKTTGQASQLHTANTSGKKVWKRALVPTLFTIHFIVQIVLPLRHHLYDSNLYWTEEGYRFSWRVMLTDKSGLAFYTVKDHDGKSTLVDLNDYLTERQQKFLGTNPDFMVQFAHFLKDTYQGKGYSQPEIYIESYLNLNGKGSRAFSNKHVNMANESWGLAPKAWILPFNDKAS